jgi:hypothetical protein
MLVADAQFANRGAMRGDDHLVGAGREHAPGHDRDAAAQRAPPASTPRTVTFDEPVCPRRSLLSPPPSRRSRAGGRRADGHAGAREDVRLLARDAARDLAVGALAQHDRVVGEPVVTSAARKPAASASAPMKIATVRPTPIAVVSVDTGAGSRCAGCSETGSPWRPLTPTRRSASTMRSREACHAGSAAHRADHDRDRDAGATVAQ